MIAVENALVHDLHTQAVAQLADVTVAQLCRADYVVSPPDA